PTDADGKINPAEADAARVRNLDPTRGKHKADVSGSGPGSLADARTRKEFCLARLRQIQVRELENSLVDVEEAEKAWSITAQTIRDALLSAPDRIAAVMPFQAEVVRQVRDMLAHEVRRILEGL